MHKIPRDARLKFIAPLLHSDEVVLDHGVALYKEIVDRLGPARSTGFLAATDRRVIFFGEYTRKPMSIPYPKIRRAIFRRKLMTCDLIIELVDGQVATFNGGKRFYADLVRLIDERRLAPQSQVDPTIVLYRHGKLNFTCSACGEDVGPGWEICSGCMRTINWDASSSAREKRRKAMEQARRDVEPLLNEDT